MNPGSWPVKIEAISSPISESRMARTFGRFSNKLTGKHVALGSKGRGTGEGKDKGKFKGGGKG